MYPRTYRPLLAFLLAITPLFSLIFAQKTVKNNGIYLLSRTIEATTDTELSALKNVPTEDIVNDRFVRLLQFDHLPMPSEKTELAKIGVQLLDYLPTNAYVAAFSASQMTNEKINEKITILTKMGLQNALILGVG